MKKKNGYMQCTHKVNSTHKVKVNESFSLNSESESVYCGPNATIYVCMLKENPK